MSVCDGSRTTRGSTGYPRPCAEFPRLQPPGIWERDNTESCHTDRGRLAHLSATHVQRVEYGISRLGTSPE